jgi:hypothetical protein
VLGGSHHIQTTGTVSIEVRAGRYQPTALPCAAKDRPSQFLLHKALSIKTGWGGVGTQSRNRHKNRKATQTDGIPLRENARFCNPPKVPGHGPKSCTCQDTGQILTCARTRTKNPHPQVGTKNPVVELTVRTHPILFFVFSNRATSAANKATHRALMEVQPSLVSIFVHRQRKHKIKNSAHLMFSCCLC